MITATYTDPFTGWEQRVTVSGDLVPDAGDEVWIANTCGEVALATADVLTDFRFEQHADTREYLPAWEPTDDQKNEDWLMPHQDEAIALDATPENSNDQTCESCGAKPTAPCTYSTNPPIARDRMHLARYVAGERAAREREDDRRARIAGQPYEIEMGMRSGTDSRDAITTMFRVTDADGRVLHEYDFTEHQFLRLLRGGIVHIHDNMEAK